MPRAGIAFSGEITRATTARYSGTMAPARTVEAHRTNIMRKLNLRTGSDLVHYAIRPLV